MIAAELLDRVLAAVAPVVAHDALATRLRADFPDIHITVCSEDDIPARLGPAAENVDCLLYYVDAGAHCLQLTNDAQAATGLAVALRSDDDR